MSEDTSRAELAALAPGGFYIALRVGFAFAVEEINTLPGDWVEHYTRARLMPYDPVVRWCYQSDGSVRWSEIDLDDPRGVLSAAAAYGLSYGAAVVCAGDERRVQRSFGSFARSDREFTEAELRQLERLLTRKHAAKTPPTNLTEAEIVVLRLVKDGLRLKQVAWEIGVSEGAVKQRLRSAKLKLGAATGTQAAMLASGFGLI